MSTEPELTVRKVVEIYAYAGSPSESSSPRRVAKWSGDPGWISMPSPGDTWFHCGDWAGETFGPRIAWCGPGDRMAHTIEVKNLGDDVVRHLVEDHGFVYEWDPDGEAA
jgi:hypothetical protein